MLLVLNRKKLGTSSRMKEYEEASRTTQENSEQKETGANSSWKSKFLGLPSKMGGWVMGKKANEEPLDSSETENPPLPLQDSSYTSPPSIVAPSKMGGWVMEKKANEECSGRSENGNAPLPLPDSCAPPPTIVVQASPSTPYEISEDEDANNYMDLLNDNDDEGMAHELNMTYDINQCQRDTDKDNQSDKDEETDKDNETVKENKEDDQGKLKNQVTDQSDCVSTDSFESASPPSETCNMHFTLANIKQEPLDEDEIEEVDENGVKVKVIKFPALQLEELFRCKRELEAFKCAQRKEDEKLVTRQQASHNAPVVEPEATVSATTSRRNPARSAKKGNKKSVTKTEKSKKKSATKETKPRQAKKTRASSSSATVKEEKSNVDELSCNECGRRFTAKSGLRNHELTHKRATGEYKCNVCGKDQFKTAHHLRQHEACHFPAETCNYCEK